MRQYDGSSSSRVRVRVREGNIVERLFYYHP